MTISEIKSPHSRVWVYQADKKLSAEQKALFEDLKQVFLENWESHGSPVKGAIELTHDRFIIVVINEEDERSCGRSVDASVRFMKELEQEFNISLLNRMLVAYKDENDIISCTLGEFEERIKKGEITKTTTVFNNTVHLLSQFENEWEVPAEKSWHARLFT